MSLEEQEPKNHNQQILRVMACSVLLDEDVNERRLREDRAAGALLSSVAHSFTDVLQGIATALDLASSSEQPPRSARYLDEANQFVLRGSRLSHQLLLWLSQAPAKLELFELEPLVRSALRPREGEIPAGLSLHFEAQAEALFLRGDPSEIEHLLRLLLDNALEALDGGGVIRVSIRSRPRTEHELAQNEESFLAVSIEDDGSGMSKEVRARCFEPFFTTRTTRDAVGLGLPIALGITRRHGGRLLLDSAPKRGTRVTVILPAASRANST